MILNDKCDKFLRYRMITVLGIIMSSFESIGLFLHALMNDQSC